MKLKYYLSIFIFAAFQMNLMAQLDWQTRSIAQFHSIDVSGNIHLTLGQGDKDLQFVMDKGDAEDLITEVDDGVLKLKFKSKRFSWKDNKKARVRVFTNMGLEEIDASAGASIKSNKLFDCKDLEIEASSGSSIQISVHANEIEAEISSGANITIKGEASFLDVEGSSGAYFDGLELETDEADAEVSSGASIKLWVTKALDAEASSGGSIQYKGNPNEKDIDVGKYSGGSVRQM